MTLKTLLNSVCIDRIRRVVRKQRKSTSLIPIWVNLECYQGHLDSIKRLNELMN